MGVNTVLGSLKAQPGDEWLVTDHAYNASRNALDAAAARSGAQVRVASVPFPLQTEEDCVGPVLAAVTPRTTLALLDHVSSQTGLVWPIARLVRELGRRGVDTLVDGAHAPGMVPLELEKLGAAYYTGNCHKWICAPKGSAFLHVRADRQDRVRPLVISHGANSRRQDRSRFQLEFGWTGTWDPSAWLAVEEALGTMAAMHPDGWPGLMRANHELALAGRRVLCEALGVPAPCPDAMLGALASVPLPDGVRGLPPRPPLFLEPLQEMLGNHGFEVPVIAWPEWPRRLLRISAQAYNTLAEYERLAGVLPGLLP
jgi:isopenicillin-N epimerase